VVAAAAAGYGMGRLTRRLEEAAQERG
jgi:hypothetical protein